MCASNTNLRLRKWLETPIVGENKIKKQKSKTTTKWEIFDNFIEMEKDEFWVNYWDNAARGKFPTGFFFNGKSLNYNYRNNTFFINLKPDIEANYRLIKHMFQSYGHIYSPIDLDIINKREFVNKESKSKPTKELKWSNYNKIQQRNLIDKYVKKISKKKNLCREDEQRMTQTLLIGLTTGRLTKDDVIIENGKIKSINNVEWLDDINRFCITVPYNIKPKKVNKKVVEKDYGKYPKWNKWVESLDNSNKRMKDKIVEIDIDEQNDDEFSSTIC